MNHVFKGGPKSIDERHYGTVFRLYAEGYGYRAISKHLMGKSSVEPLIKGRGSYTGRRVPVKETTL